MTHTAPQPPRGSCWLFCPADRPDRYAKALAAADVVILDLEDAVAAADKPAARVALRASDLDPARVIVRVNGRGSGELGADLAVVRETPYRFVMLPKVESPADVDAVADLAVVALVETPAGLRVMHEVAAHHAVVAVMWGAEDFAASVGAAGPRHEDGTFRDTLRALRTQTLLACAESGPLAVDTVFTRIGDPAGLAAESAQAAADGFTVKACIHPSQVPVVRAALRPADDQVAWARAVLAATSGSGGVVSVGEEMVDAPVLARAARIVALADAQR